MILTSNYLSFAMKLEAQSWATCTCRDAWLSIVTTIGQLVSWDLSVSIWMADGLTTSLENY